MSWTMKPTNPTMKRLTMLILSCIHISEVVGLRDSRSMRFVFSQNALTSKFVHLSFKGLPRCERKERLISF